MRKIIESSLSRLYSKMLKHETGTMTAYRNKEYNENRNIIHIYTKKENQARNKSLLAKLQNAGYLVTSVKGSYIENFGTSKAVEVGEHTFFIEDNKDTGKLRQDLIKLGEDFNQDSVMFIHKYGKEADLIGTNKTGYPGYHKEIHYRDHKFGVIGKFMTKVGNRPFFFENIQLYHQDAQGYLGKWALDTIANMTWEDLLKEGLL